MNFKSEFGNHFWNLCRLSAWAQTRPSPHRPKSGHGLVPAAMDLVKALAPNETMASEILKLTRLDFKNKIVP